MGNHIESKSCTNEVGKSNISEVRCAYGKRSLANER